MSAFRKLATQFDRSWELSEWREYCIGFAVRTAPARGRALELLTSVYDDQERKLVGSICVVTTDAVLNDDAGITAKMFEHVETAMVKALVEPLKARVREMLPETMFRKGDDDG
jgi:hypothetical protein